MNKQAIKKEIDTRVARSNSKAVKPDVAKKLTARLFYNIEYESLEDTATRFDACSSIIMRDYTTHKDQLQQALEHLLGGK